MGGVLPALPSQLKRFGNHLQGAEFEPYVAGVQSDNVFAVMKHWICNEQETSRGSESSGMDEKTSWEWYYPPFQAGPDGLAAISKVPRVSWGQILACVAPLC